MKASFLHIIALILPLQLSATGAPALKLIAEIKGFASPESIAWDGTHYYVSNVGKELKPTEKDGDGFISRMDARGGNLQLDFIGGLNAPKGILVCGKILYVCDIDVLSGFDLTTGKKTFEVSFAGNGVRFLNDVCAAGEDKLLVSATDTNQVFLVDLKAKSARPVKFDHAPKGPNGLIFAAAEDETYLGVAEWGSDNKPNGGIGIYTLDGSLLSAEEVKHPDDSPIKKGYMDGLALLKNDEKGRGILYSDWVAFKPGGKLFYYDSREEDPSKALAEIAIPNGPVAGPADFFHDAKTSALVMPCMIEGRVLLMKLENDK